MRLIIIWFLSYITSLGMNLANNLMIYKDAADNGYKFKNTLDNDAKEELDNLNRNPLAFIPGLNILNEFFRLFAYSYNKSEVLNDLYYFNAFEEMNDAEKKMYSLKPTGLNAFCVPFVYKNRLANAYKVEILDDVGTSYIYFDFFYDDNEIEILKAEGIASKFSNEMQIKIVKDTLDALEKINSKNNSSNEMKPKEEKKKEPKCELAIVKEYQILEELKKMLLDQKTIENSPEESTKLKRKR